MLFYGYLIKAKHMFAFDSTIKLKDKYPFNKIKAELKLKKNRMGIMDCL